MIRLHRWLGAALATFALLFALSGGLLLWSDEYHGWRYPQLREATGGAPPTARAIAAALDAAGAPVGTIAMPRERLPAFLLYLRDGREALHDAHTGALIARWGTFHALPSVLFELHVRLFAGEPGHVAAGVLGLAVPAMVFTGLWVWWPRRRRLRPTGMLPRRGSNLGLLKAHAAQGVMLGLLLAFLGLSGAAIVFHAPAEGLLKATLGSRGPDRPQVRAAPGAGTRVDWQAVLASAQQQFPEAVLRFATLPEKPGQPLYLRLRQPGELHPNGRSYLVLDPGTGRTLERIDATRTGTGPAVFNALYPLHAGKTGWPGHRLLLLVAALALAYIAGSGLLLALRRAKAAGGARPRT